MKRTLAQAFYEMLTQGFENLGRDYKSSFDNQGTPPRRRKAKSSYKKFKLFTGHRP
jgi:hypothetical protein